VIGKCIAPGSNSSQRGCAAIRMSLSAISALKLTTD
jgi:hypothetical protein